MHQTVAPCTPRAPGCPSRHLQNPKPRHPSLSDASRLASPLPHFTGWQGRYGHPPMGPTVPQGRSSCKCSAAKPSSLSIADSMDILELEGGDIDAAELRQAYYNCMRTLHPDVNPERDTTELAALANAAYATLLEEVNNPSSGGLIATGNAFDRCEAAPDIPFISPFDVGVDPFEWRALQAALIEQLLARQTGRAWPLGAGASRATPRTASAGASADAQKPELDASEVTEVDIEGSLLALGLRGEPGVVAWLTPAQHAAAEAMMQEALDTFAFDVVVWQLGDALRRSVRTNRRGPP
eukprot:jgi/Ulvmu1/1640/UM114_0006.1